MNVFDAIEIYKMIRKKYNSDYLPPEVLIGMIDILLTYIGDKAEGENYRERLNPEGALSVCDSPIPENK